MQNKTSESQAKTFTFRISRNLVGGLLSFIFLVIAFSFTLIWFGVRPQIAQLSLDKHSTLAQNIALALERELQEAKGVASTMASAVLALPAENRAAQLPNLIPAILTPSGKETLYAGGGVWPEPYTLDPQRGRNSYFWIQDKQDKLVFVDDYNQAEGAGYQREPWYVLAPILNSSAVYWSAVHRDSFSQHLLIKCVAPMFEAAQFRGVATVDIKLDSLAKVVNQQISGLDAYAFVLDRNGHFVVFPTLGYDVSRRSIKSMRSGFDYLANLAEDYPHFDQIVAQMKQVDQALLTQLGKEKPERLALVERLQEASYGLSESEARQLLANLWLSEKSARASAEALATFDITDDALLKADSHAFVYPMPSTNWRLVTVFKQDAYASKVNSITRHIFAAILLALSIFGLLAWLLLHKHLIAPMKAIVNFIVASMNGRKKRPAKKMPGKRRDEFGLLAWWFNHSNKLLEKSIAKTRRASKAKSDFLAGMAHELRTPIQSIIGFNRKLIVKMGSDLDDQNYKHLIAVQRSSHHLLNLIEDIFEVSQIESGKVKLKFQLESTNALLDDAVSQMAGQIADAKLELEVHALDEDINILADRHKIIQVLIHLIANALQSTEKGKITVFAEATYLAETEAVAFCVEDTGKGMSDEEKHLVFKQFTRAEEYAGIEHGIGLGLYLVREIVALHSGALYFDSTLGQGSRFTVVFLVKPAASQSELDHESDEDDESLELDENEPSNLPA